MTQPISRQTEETVGWKVLERKPLTGKIQTYPILKMTLLTHRGSIKPFLKVRILRLWNQTVSSVKATTQSPSLISSTLASG